MPIQNSLSRKILTALMTSRGNRHGNTKEYYGNQFELNETRGPPKMSIENTREMKEKFKLRYLKLGKAKLG